MNILARRNGMEWEAVPKFEDVMRRFFDLAGVDGNFDFAPSRLEVKVNDEDVSVKMAAPGCRPEDFDIEVVGDFVTIRARRKEKAEEHEDARCIIQEREYGELEESTKLPVMVLGSQAKATYVDGVLEVVIPRETAKKVTSHVVKVR